MPGRNCLARPFCLLVAHPRSQPSEEQLDLRRLVEHLCGAELLRFPLSCSGFADTSDSTPYRASDQLQVAVAQQGLRAIATSSRRLLGVAGLAPKNKLPATRVFEHPEVRSHAVQEPRKGLADSEIHQSQGVNI